jgi:hypothetical protein
MRIICGDNAAGGCEQKYKHASVIGDKCQKYLENGKIQSLNIL